MGKHEQNQGVGYAGAVAQAVASGVVSSLSGRAAIAVILALSVAPSLPSVPPVPRGLCEARLGRAMTLLAASEGQRPAVALLSLQLEMLPAFQAGMLIEEIAFCLSLPVEAVELVLGELRFSDAPADGDGSAGASVASLIPRAF